MKKSIFITIVLFLGSTILQLLLNIIMNEQILSRILYGVDYNTYFMQYYSGQSGLLRLISGSKMPYEWVFLFSKFIIAIFCIIVLFLTIKKLKNKYTVTKKEFIIIISIFSILSLYDVIIYIVMFHTIPPIKYFALPIIFIVSAYIGIYKMLYLQSIKNDK